MGFCVILSNFFTRLISMLRYPIRIKLEREKGINTIVTILQELVFVYTSLALAK